MKKAILISILIISIMFLVGCAREVILVKELPEAAEPAAPAVAEMPAVTSYETAEGFVSAFIDFWKAGNYEQLYSMFVQSSIDRLPKERFVYLFGREFKDIKSIKQVYYDIRDSSAKFSVLVSFYDGSSKRVSLIEVVKREDGWKMNGLKQYFDPLDYCRTEHNSEVCLYDYANEFKEADWCKYAGTLFKKCYDSLNVKLTVDQIREICSRYTITVATQAECYKVLAYEEGNNYYCSTIQMATKQYECYGNVAAKHSNLTECETIRDEHAFGEAVKAYAYCIAGYVEKTGNAGTCDEIIVSDVYTEEGRNVCLAYS